MTKVYTEPVPTTFSKDQVAGYESFSSQEYYRLAYEIAGDIIGGEYGIHKLEDYDLVWSPSGKTCSEHLFSLIIRYIIQLALLWQTQCSRKYRQ